MNLKQLYDFVISHGKKNDPRGEKEVDYLLQEENKKYQKLSEKEKKYYDVEKLKNPYKDSRILYGDDTLNVKSILVGIDIEAPEIMLAHMLNTQGKKVDLVLGHHPEGRAYTNFYEVMKMQADVLNKFGVPINIAESIMEPRIKEVSRRVMPINHNRAVDIARVLNVAFMNCHTPADNCVATYLQNLFDEKKPRYLGDVIDLLLDIPEYDYASKLGNGPTILIGNSQRKTGKVFVDMTGGTEGSVEVFEKLAVSGVSTVVAMHLSEEHYKNAEKHHIQVVIAGHISSDNLGLNLMLDAVENKFGKLDIIEVSGFKRFLHKKK